MNNYHLSTISEAIEIIKKKNLNKEDGYMLSKSIYL